MHMPQSTLQAAPARHQHLPFNPLQQTSSQLLVQPPGPCWLHCLHARTNDQQAGMLKTQPALHPLCRSSASSCSALLRRQHPRVNDAHRDARPVVAVSGQARQLVHHLLPAHHAPACQHLLVHVARHGHGGDEELRAHHGAVIHHHAHRAARVAQLGRARAELGAKHRRAAAAVPARDVARHDAVARHHLVHRAAPVPVALLVRGQANKVLHHCGGHPALIQPHNHSAHRHTPGLKIQVHARTAQLRTLPHPVSIEPAAKQAESHDIWHRVAGDASQAPDRAAACPPSTRMHVPHPCTACMCAPCACGMLPGACCCS
mmetsp:Transcript_7341/g.18211  ORF Transcript_7341/g.18211 Transcript_7341/m.18211 type:complete len:317 (-) Transcript_7341:143-1093(-)